MPKEKEELPSLLLPNAAALLSAWPPPLRAGVMEEKVGLLLSAATVMEEEKIGLLLSAAGAMESFLRRLTTQRAFVSPPPFSLLAAVLMPSARRNHGGCRPKRSSTGLYIEAMVGHLRRSGLIFFVDVMHLRQTSPVPGLTGRSE